MCNRMRQMLPPVFFNRMTVKLKYWHLPLCSWKIFWIVQCNVDWCTIILNRKICVALTGGNSNWIMDLSPLLVWEKWVDAWREPLVIKGNDSSAVFCSWDYKRLYSTLSDTKTYFPDIVTRHENQPFPKQPLPQSIYGTSRQDWTFGKYWLQWIF